MNILGVNSVYHESAAALVVDGVLVVACEEERFNRIKHGKQAQVDNPHQFPEHAIRFCLDYAGLRGCDIDHVAYSFDPRLRRMQWRAEWWPDPRWEEVFLLRLGEVRAVAERILRRPLRQRFHFVPHHLAHAASAYFPSGFDRAAILTIDGIGEVACSTLATAVGTRIQMLETFNHPHSLGFLWEVISVHLGFSPYDASKVMGLAAYGNPETFRRQLQSAIRVDEEGYAVDQEAAGFLTAKLPGLETSLGTPRFPVSLMSLYRPRRTMLAPQSAPRLSCIAQNGKARPSEATPRHFWAPRSIGAKFWLLLGRPVSPTGAAKPPRATRRR
jgi:carbamoyltransferase